MEHGPLPPHERLWRHPSEVAAEEHASLRAETATGTMRWFAITTGTFGLLAIGLLVMVVTPSGSTAPVALSATTTPAVITTTPAPAAEGAATADVTAIAGRPAAIGLRSAVEANATPVGDGGLAVMTPGDVTAAIGSTGLGRRIEVVVPSGDVHEAAVVGVAGDAVVVHLASAEPGLSLAERLPADDDIVTVLDAPPITVAFADLVDLEVDEGLAVVDDDGRLVGLCRDRLRGTDLVEIDASGTLAD